MGELSSTFTRDDIATLIESVGDWEMLGSQEFHLMKMVLDAPLPPDDHEAHEAMVNIKEHFRRKEREINDHRSLRQEKAVFIKAKLMLVRRDMDVNSVFEMATEPTASPPAVPPPVPKAPSKKKAVLAANEAQAKLEMAEFFIRDLGVWDHYQRFLKERAD